MLARKYSRSGLLPVDDGSGCLCIQIKPKKYQQEPGNGEKI
jgi:hypothetical protein